MTAGTISKRMAILVRRPVDDRATFARHWQFTHGAMVSQLPKLRCYVQSHVVEDFPLGGETPEFRADGFVEQQYDSPADMQEAYSSPIVKAMLVDEPNFLGHATNYATLSTAAVRPEPEGRKLILVVRHGGDTGLMETIEGEAAAFAGCAGAIRDCVVTVIPKAGMQEGPQMVDAFLQLYYEDVEAARRAGRGIAERSGAWPGAGVCVYRAATVRIV